jgi:hypothetical protein
MKSKVARSLFSAYLNNFNDLLSGWFLLLGALAFGTVGAFFLTDPGGSKLVSATRVSLESPVLVARTVEDYGTRLCPSPLSNIRQQWCMCA